VSLVRVPSDIRISSRFQNSRRTTFVENGRH
jgi:hypothetical protein